MFICRIILSRSQQFLKIIPCRRQAELCLRKSTELKMCCTPQAAVSVDYCHCLLFIVFSVCTSVYLCTSKASLQFLLFANTGFPFLFFFFFLFFLGIKCWPSLEVPLFIIWIFTYLIKMNTMYASRMCALAWQSVCSIFEEIH